MNDESIRRYRVSEQAAAERLAELRQIDAIADLDDQIALVKFLCEEKLNSASTPGERASAATLIGTLSTVLDRLVKSKAKLQERAGEVLTKKAILGVADEIVAAITDELRGLPQWEERVDRVTARIATAIGNAQN